MYHSSLKLQSVKVIFCIKSLLFLVTTQACKMFANVQRWYRGVLSNSVNHALYIVKNYFEAGFGNASHRSLCHSLRQEELKWAGHEQ